MGGPNPLLDVHVKIDNLKMDKSFIMDIKVDVNIAEITTMLKKGIYFRRIAGMITRHDTIILILLIVTAVIPGCSPDRDKRYYCRDEGFSISFPKEWKIAENIKGTRILAEIPDEHGISIIKQNINVVVEDIRLPVGLREYMDLQINSLQKLKGMKIFEKGDATINGAATRWFMYSYTINDFGYKAVVYVFNRGRKFYVITGISQFNNFGKYESLFHETAKSFRLE